MTAALAEVTGALLGDGCLSKYYVASEQRWRYEISFTGSNSDFCYYSQIVRPAFVNSFGLRGRLFVRKDDNSTRFHVKSRRVFEFFRSLGLPVGKKPRNLKIPQAIAREQHLALPCVRGLWNTDGSIYRRFTKKYPSQKKFYGGYLVMQLKMNTRPLLLQVKKILEGAGIRPAPILRDRNAFTLRIGEQASIEKYLKTIGFSNQHHLARLEAFSPPATF